MEAKFDKLDGSFQGYNDLNCAKSVRCFFCYIKNYQRCWNSVDLATALQTLCRFTLRGLCRGSKGDTRFVSNKDSIQDGR